MGTKSTVNNNFEYLANLAASNPDKFEEHREKLINEFIQKMPSDKKDWLKKIQWRVDQARRQAKTPIGACILISNMMMESVYGRDGMLKSLESLEHGAIKPRESAKIIPISSKKR